MVGSSQDQTGSPGQFSSPVGSHGIGSVDVLDALSRIRASQTFSNSERLLQFLEFVVGAALKGEAHKPKESSIGVELLHRVPSYDPKLDSVVRSQARRLRAGLELYYASEGVADSIIIEIHRGGYVPVFRYREAPVTEQAATDLVAPEATPLPASQAPPKWIWAIAVLLLLLLIMGVSAYLWRPFVGPPNAPAPSPVVTVPLPRVAILEFQTAKSGSDESLYGRALADSIISWLARINDLSIVTPTASGGSAVPDTEFARRMKADYIVSGHFEKKQGQSRIWVRLTDAARDTVIWSQTYSFAWASLLQVEEEMGSAVTRSLSLKLSESHAAAVGSVPAGSAEAYQAYLNGHYSLVHARQTFQPGSLRAAERHPKRALELDPSYPDALAELATLNFLAVLPWSTESAKYLEDAENEAKAALVRAPRHAMALSFSQDV